MKTYKTPVFLFKKIVFFITISIISSTIFAITLEEDLVSENELSHSADVMDSRKAPNSLLGHFAATAAELAVKGKIEQDSSCKMGGCSFVVVNFEVESGLSPEGTDRVLKLTSAENRHVIFKPSASKDSVTIHKASQSVTGKYHWYATWKNGSKGCSGVISISGRTPLVSIRVNPDCRDAGSTLQ